jgi:hypothetical protein
MCCLSDDIENPVFLLRRRSSLQVTVYLFSGSMAWAYSSAFSICSNAFCCNASIGAGSVEPGTISVLSWDSGNF